MADTTISLRKNVATKSQHAQRTFVAEILTHSGSMGANQVYLQFLDGLGRNDNILEVSKSSVDSVLDNLILHNIIYDLSSRLGITTLTVSYINLLPSLLT